ncbi:MarR family protein [Phycisphaerae bacterium RAS1]|nr:MarR family protein [Phycisphaerae bacterium RAS1]
MTADRDILEALPGVLAELTSLGVSAARNGRTGERLLRMGPHLVAAVAKSSSRAAAIAQAADSARLAAKRAGPRAVPLVAVPYMGEVGARVCREHKVSFVDLSGNAEINAPGLRIHVAGKPNRFIRRGRPSSVFAPKSSRLARLMLQDPNRPWRQSELAEASQLGAGYVSRICKRLEEDRLVERRQDGAIRSRAPELLLEAWQAEYDFRRHDIRMGHIAAHTGDELARRLVGVFGELSVPYALTGLAAAWLLAPFAAYRLVTVYLRKPPGEKLLQRLKWHEEKRGANLWLVRPNDEGVFHGVESVGGVECVSPVQAYLDLRGLPERAEEAADHLRKERLQWR